MFLAFHRASVAAFVTSADVRGSYGARKLKQERG